MAWARLDDGFHAHRKTLGASLEALGLYAVALSWVSSQETDGLIPRHVAHHLARGDISLCHRLVASSLWETEIDDYRIHDYLRYNPSHKSLVRKRKQAVRSTQAWRKRERVLSDQRDINAASRNTGRDGMGSSSSSERKEKGAGRGRRPAGLPLPMPEPFELTEARRAWAIKGGLHPEREWGHFKDYHRAKGSRWADWDAAWRNWCRNEVKFEARGKA